MSDTTRNEIRREVLKYVKGRTSAVTFGAMAEALRQKNDAVRESDVRSVVQPMIATGRLNYAPGLKIRLGANK
jgi:hypothetical protein